MDRIKNIIVKVFACFLNKLFLKPILPDKFVLYGHLISDNKHLAANRYRYPQFKEFSEFISLVHSLGYCFVSFSNYLKKDGKKKILLTFDDGFKAIRNDTHPYLAERKIPYMIFVLTAPLVSNEFQIDEFKTTAKSSPENEYLNISDLEFLKSEGVEIGFHTKNHKLTSGEDILDTSEYEIEGHLRYLFTEPLSFAYPFYAPDRFKAIDEQIKNLNGSEFFFNTKGVLQNEQNHFYRMSIDTFLENKTKNVIIYNLKLEAAMLVIKKIKGTTIL